MNATTTTINNATGSSASKPKARITMMDANAIAQKQQMMQSTIGSVEVATFKTNPGERLTHKSNLPDLNTAPPQSDFDVPGRIFRMVPLNRIRQNRYAPRSVYTDAMLKERAESIRNEGQNDPIHVIPDPDFPGDFIIGDGWTRVQGCLKFDVCDELLAEIHEGVDEREISLLGYDQNENRAGHCDYDRAVYFHSLLESGYLQTDIESRFKVSQSKVSKLSAFLKLPEEVIEVVKKYPTRINYRIAQYLANLHNHTNTEITTVLAKRYCMADGMSESGFAALCKKTIHDFKNDPSSFESASTENLNTKENEKNIERTNRFVQHFENGKLARRDGSYKLDLKVPPEKDEEFQEAMKKLLEQFATPMTKPLARKAQAN